METPHVTDTVKLELSYLLCATDPLPLVVRQKFSFQFEII